MWGVCSLYLWHWEFLISFQGFLHLVVTGSLKLLQGLLPLFAAEGLLPKCNVLEGSYLILAGESSPVLAGGS